VLLILVLLMVETRLMSWDTLLISKRRALSSLGEWSSLSSLSLESRERGLSTHSTLRTVDRRCDYWLLTVSYYYVVCTQKNTPALTQLVVIQLIYSIGVVYALLLQIMDTSENIQQMNADGAVWVAQAQIGWWILELRWTSHLNTAYQGQQFSRCL